MSLFSTPKKPNNTPSTTQTPTTNSAHRLKFRTDGSLLPPTNPIKLTSPISLNTTTNTPNHKSTHQTPSDTTLNLHLTNLLARFFSPLNTERVFFRTLGKLSPEMQLDILGDVDAWEFLEGKKQLTRERKLWLVKVYGVFDREMRAVLREGWLGMGVEN